MTAQLPDFLPLPQAVIADEANPTVAEITAFRTRLDPWRTTVLANLTVLNPNHGFNLAFPKNPAAVANRAARITRLQDLRTYGLTLYPLYAAAYATFANALAAGNIPAQPPALALLPPKTALPEKFLGKSATAARHFLQQCENYAAICPFASPGQEIRWMLQLMEGDASHWRAEQLSQYARVPPPAHLMDRAMFEAEFKARWADPYEGEKALDKILKGQIIQRTSVKNYNDQFNEALSLTTLTGKDASILRSYEAGLKPTIRKAATVALIGYPNVDFHDRQMLMVFLDESLMQTCGQTNPTTQSRYASTSPVTALPSATAPRNQTPIKVEAARQHTRPTPEEREHLRKIGACFKCRERGHMAHQCPRNAQVTNVAPVVSTPIPDLTKEFQLQTDASSYAYGAVLSQKAGNGKHRPIAFYSEPMSPAERNYTISDKETLAVVKSLQHWNHWLEGVKVPIQISTDHRDLQLLNKPR